MLTNKHPKEIAGRGTGVDDEGLNRKISAIERALDVNKPNANDGLDVLAKVGGFEIGGLAGVMLGAASQRRPVMIDGFISTAAAMIAVIACAAVQKLFDLCASFKRKWTWHHARMAGLETFV